MEKVLCIRRDRLPAPWVAHQSVLPLEMDDFITQCTQSGFSFIDRSLAEEEPAYKQIIPYILLQTFELTAVYSRKGSEKRLHDLWSTGIGGHINPVDSRMSQADFGEIIKIGMTRELDEELIKRPISDSVEFLGVINEESAPVSTVHLGAVFRIRTRTPEAYQPGPELSRFQWVTQTDLNTLNLELWSRLALELAGRA